jgi:hypothetical protein
MFIRLEGNIDVCLAWRRAIKVGSVTIIMVVPSLENTRVHVQLLSRHFIYICFDILKSVQNSLQICVEKRDGQRASIKEFDSSRCNRIDTVSTARNLFRGWYCLV